MRLHAIAAAACAHRRSSLRESTTTPSSLRLGLRQQKLTDSSKSTIAANWQSTGFKKTHSLALFGEWTRAPFRGSGVQHPGGCNILQPAPESFEPRNPIHDEA
eukprot:6175061-Pleurochrysis_carterae.AAC.1